MGYDVGSSTKGTNIQVYVDTEHKTSSTNFHLFGEMKSMTRLNIKYEAYNQVSLA